MDRTVAMVAAMTRSTNACTAAADHRWLAETRRVSGLAVLKDTAERETAMPRWILRRPAGTPAHPAAALARECWRVTPMVRHRRSGDLG